MAEKGSFSHMMSIDTDVEAFSLSMALDDTDEEDGAVSGKSQTPDSSQVRQKKRSTGRNRAEERLKIRGDAGPYTEAIQELLLEKEEERKLREERWKETRMFQERKLSIEKRKLAFEKSKLTFEKHKLMREQEQKIMSYDVRTLDPDQKNYVLAMKAQIAAQNMAAFCSGLGSGFDGWFGAPIGGDGGDVDGATI